METIQNLISRLPSVDELPEKEQVDRKDINYYSMMRQSLERNPNKHVDEIDVDLFIEMCHNKNYTTAVCFLNTKIR